MIAWARTLSSFNVGPLSAWLGTAEMVLFAASLVWLAISKLTRRRA